MKRLVFFLLLLVVPLTAFGTTIEVAPGVLLHVELPGDHWQVSDSPPEPLVQETAAHLRQEMLRKAGKEDPAEVARDILSVNELFIVNAESGAWLAVDFSALREGEPAPGRRAVKRSAAFAGQALQGEEGLSDVKHDVEKIRIPGAQYAYQLEATYRRHDEPVLFCGVIGFADRHWFYLYYTDFKRNPEDYREMKEILRSIRLKVERS
ncbi:hypothetical protein MJO47_07585 [Desulfuromonas sp. KJ2020]|uniref:hypothetical protein n=1 Tax=Desulfuromonas sp. KJ2020 TaxID=2919173 RepID=UPI0020A7FD57|nr:hypothetical protein [Desulfuromonas sp. KJ2020]MCP3176964.1 hypothetical protein [Desulfuromonas sp. KJ2020]